MQSDEVTHCLSVASAYDAAGDARQARDWIDCAFVLDPDHPAIWLTRLSAYGEEIDDEALEILQTIPARRRLDGEEPSMWHFALGRAYDNRNRFDDAWFHYSKANELLSQLRPCDETVDACHVEAAIELVGSDLLESANGFVREGGVMGQPIFVIGFPGSGTTLVEQILASHPDVHGGGEQVVIIKAAAKLTKLGLQGRPYVELFGRVAPEVLASLASSAADEYEKMAGSASRVTDKLPTNYFHVCLIRLLFPGAPIVHVRRDPIDTCVTNYLRMYAKGNNYANDIVDLASAWARYARIMEHWVEVMPPSSIHHVEYQELVADQEHITRQMLEFCGLSWDERCIRFNENSRAVHTASRRAVRQPIYRTSVGRSRRFGHHLDRLGDELDRRVM